MIAYEIQLVCNPRQNSVGEKIWEKDVLPEDFSEKKLSEKNVLDVVSDFQCTKWAVSDKSMLIITKRFIQTASIDHF